MKKSYVIYIKTKEDVVHIFRVLSISKKYVLYSRGSLVDMQVYNKVNENHLWPVSDFILDKDYEEKEVKLETEGYEVKFIFKEGLK